MLSNVLNFAALFEIEQDEKNIHSLRGLAAVLYFFVESDTRYGGFQEIVNI